MKLLHLLIAIVLSVPSALTVAAEDAPAKTKKPAAKADEAAKPKRLPLKGTVISITSATLTLKAAEGKPDRKFSINKETQILKGEAPATTADVKAGQIITGSYIKNADGSATLTKLQVAPKPSTPKKPKGEDAKKTGSEATKK